MAQERRGWLEREIELRGSIVLWKKLIEGQLGRWSLKSHRSMTQSAMKLQLLETTTRRQHQEAIGCLSTALG